MAASEPLTGLPRGPTANRPIRSRTVMVMSSKTA